MRVDPLENICTSWLIVHYGLRGKYAQEAGKRMAASIRRALNA